MRRLLSIIKHVFRKEGLTSLIKRTFEFAISLLFEHRTFYLYERPFKSRPNKADFLPKVQDYSLKILTSSEQLDYLQKDGFDLSLLNVEQAKYRLTKTAILILVLINNELAHRRWLAINEEAKNTFNNYPYKVDFENGEACGGDTWTNPKYRRQGINLYVDYESEKYQLEQGVKWSRSIVDTKNRVSLATYKRRDGAKIYAKARYLRIFRFKSWKEYRYLE